MPKKKITKEEVKLSDELTKEAEDLALADFKEFEANVNKFKVDFAFDRAELNMFKDKFNALVEFVCKK